MALFGLHMMLCHKQSKSAKHWDSFLSHCRSSRVPKPLIKYGSAYGDKPTIQIEREIKSDKAWQKTVEPKAKAIIRKALNTFHNDLETIVKEGGNKSIHYLLAQAVDIEKNPRELQYRQILQLKDSNPKSFQE